MQRTILQTREEKIRELILSYIMNQHQFIILPFPNSNFDERIVANQKMFRGTCRIISSNVHSVTPTENEFQIADLLINQMFRMVFNARKKLDESELRAFLSSALTKAIPDPIVTPQVEKQTASSTADLLSKLLAMKAKHDEEQALEIVFSIADKKAYISKFVEAEYANISSTGKDPGSLREASINKFKNKCLEDNVQFSEDELKMVEMGLLHRIFFETTFFPPSKRQTLQDLLENNFKLAEEVFILKPTRGTKASPQLVENPSSPDSRDNNLPPSYEPNATPSIEQPKPTRCYVM